MPKKVVNPFTFFAEVSKKVASVHADVAQPLVEAADSDSVGCWFDPSRRHLSFGAPLISPGGSLCMTIRAQDAQILQAVVCLVAVDVIQLKWRGLSSPFGDVAAFALSFLDAETYKPATKAISVPTRVFAQHLFDWARALRAAKSCSFGPALADEMRRRQREPFDVLFNSGVTSASDAKSQFANHLGGCATAAYRLDELLICP